MILEVSSENFEEKVLKSDKTVLVDFWASWCGPCRMLSPIVDEVAEEAGNNIQVCKVNVDEEGDLATQYNVMSIPTLVVIQNGKEVKRMVGVQSKENILEAIK